VDPKCAYADGYRCSGTDHECYLSFSSEWNPPLAVR
jgi:hypothetical protein